MQQFEEIYLSCRKRENRLMSDAEVKQLPGIASNHPHHHEWQIRAQSARRLIEYLRKRKMGSILDVGCGTGWLANRMSDFAKVVAIDVQSHELLQGKRLFPQVNFVQGNILDDEMITEEHFDAVVMASSIQYFRDIHIVIQKLLTYLKSKGEIHILDSPIYRSTAEVQIARQRSAQYFQSISPQMEQFYFHHCEQDFEPFSIDKLFDPNALLPRLRRKIGLPQTPFPWLCIRKE